MPLEQHPLYGEFPQFQTELARLLSNDARFARLAEAYRQLDQQIQDARVGRLAVDELTLQDLKNQRIALKDRLAERLARALI